MGKYLKLHDTASEHQAYTAYTNASYLEPYVSVTLDNDAVHYNRVRPNYLRFTAVDGDATIALKSYSSGTETASTFSIETSEGGSTWTSWDGSVKTIASGSTLLMRGNNPNGLIESPSYDNYVNFVMTGTISASGNIQSLVYGDECDNSLAIPCSFCYEGMFAGCSGLTTAPELPATTLAEGCYQGMFFGCTSLTTAPELPATSLETTGSLYGSSAGARTESGDMILRATIRIGVYGSMFRGCTSLTTAPELPATTLANYCYYSMFNGCTNLTTAPELPATTLANECYYSMFSGCTSLNSITCLATDISAADCTYNWVSNVSPSGTFTKAASMNGWTTGVNGIPSNWTVQTASE